VRETLVARTAGLMAKAKAEGKLTSRSEAGDWIHANSKILETEERNLVVDRVFGEVVNPTKLHRKQLPATDAAV
jgi:DNA invertase Pin-like site-specific DNA recombinase